MPKERIVATIGYPGHGKTVFLACLFWDSFFTLSETFQDERQPYSVHAMKEEASKVFFDNAKLLNRLELPTPNPRKKPEPATLEFKGVPCANHRWWRSARQNIQLTFYDIAGELATSDNWLHENAPFLPHAHDIIFLFDPIREDFNESVLLAAELRDRIYRVVPDSKRKHFIIVLSKIDELRDQDRWWSDVTAQRWPNSAPSLSSLPDYLRQMDELSSPDKLVQWLTNKAHGARQLINALPQNTHYCALSSLGHEPVWDCLKPNCHTTNPNTLQECSKCHAARERATLRLTRKPEPYRVRDPLFWIFREAGVM